MAQYKVPQDVEADDKLLGPFSFRQFVYLMVAAVGIAGAWGLFQLFPLLALIPIPIIIIFAVLALPLRKDQPMEAYLAGVVSFFLKPKKRLWNAGQRESTVLITAPKTIEKQLTKNVSGEEASRRLSFLAEIADSEGRSVKGPSTAVREEFIAEANAISDMFAPTSARVIDQQIDTEAAERHAEAIEKMRDAIEDANAISPLDETPEISRHADPVEQAPAPTPALATIPIEPTPQLQNLSTDPDLTVATIQKEANRISNQQNDEVFVSLR